MKRDLELFRNILSQIEDSDEFYVSKLTDYHDYDKFANNLMLLEEADLITGRLEFRADGKLYSYKVRLTNKGYEYIALAKNNSIWFV